MAKRKKKKKQAEAEPVENESAVFEPDPPKKRLAAMVVFGVLTAIFLGYLLIVAVAS